jgi:hypothetical protein
MRHGMNVQVPADPFGRLLWVSPALPGAVHDVRAAREHGIVDALAEADITAGPTRATGVPAARSVPRTGDGGRPLSAGQPVVHRSCARIRALVAQAIASLMSWRLLRKLRCSTTRITCLVQARPHPAFGRLRPMMEKPLWLGMRRQLLSITGLVPVSGAVRAEERHGTRSQILPERP